MARYGKRRWDGPSPPPMPEVNLTAEQISKFRWMSPPVKASKIEYHEGPPHPSHASWNFGPGRNVYDNFPGLRAYRGVELLCRLPEGRTPIEVVSVLPPTWFGDLAYLVKFKNNSSGEIKQECVFHLAFKFEYPQLLIQCYEKNTAFSEDTRTDDELAAVVYGAVGEAREREDADDSSDEEAFNGKKRGHVPLVDSTSSESETESESDTYEMIDMSSFYVSKE